MTSRACNTAALGVLLLVACSGSPGVDGGVDAGDAEACPSQCGTRSTCTMNEGDGPCMQRCRCTYGQLTECVSMCPQAQNCVEGAFCDRGSRTACGTTDAGCAIECSCYSHFVMRYARCATRCGGQQFDCARELNPTDAGCADVTTCTYASGSCQCAPDAGWSCTP